eukprot:Gb_09086 [translate_table: standard]
MGDRQRKCSVCVTGAGGYIGSWLVKNLLHKGYTVHATLRDPGNQAKTGHLLSLPGAKESLKLFKADLSEEGSFDSAVTGCEGVFHVASPMDFSKDHEGDLIKLAVKGVVNVLRACTKAGTVKRLVYTSSVTAASPLINDTGEYSECLDESRWTDLDLIIRNKKLWKYCASKTLAEQAAIKLGNENQIEVVSIAPALVGGPCLTPTLPRTTQTTLSPITGKGEYYEMLKSLRHVLGSIPLVHIDDVCNAQIFLMEQPSAQGRHICSSCSLDMNELVENFCKCYPQSNVQFKFEDQDCIGGGVATSSKKLLDMGFCYNYGPQEILDQSIKCAIMMGVLQ